MRRGDEIVPGRRVGRTGADAHAEGALLDESEGALSVRKRPVGHCAEECMEAVDAVEFGVSRDQVREMRLELAR
ncbi:MAG: hypothetical protein HPY44_00935 [Armatimonadetes bacterium]|nr:hypothetical protein [Armatimonadota bacterium]